MYLAFIVNPTAGTGYAVKVMNQLKAILQEREIEYRVLETDSPGHATSISAELAGNKDVRAVISVGGDGTASEVAAGLTGTGKPMGIIPAGTGNDFIKSAGIPKDPAKALELILSGKPADTDTGTVNDNFFLNVCGTGFDVTVLDFAENEKKRHRGLTPYLIGLIKAIFHYESIKLKVKADGKTVEKPCLICTIANGRYIGGGIPICPAADPADGLLDLVLIKHRARWQIPFYLPGLMLSRDMHFRITTHQRVKEVTVEGKNLRFNIDGNISPMDKATFRIQPAGLKLIRS